MEPVLPWGDVEGGRSSVPRARTVLLVRIRRVRLLTLVGLWIWLLGLVLLWIWLLRWVLPRRSIPIRLGLGTTRGRVLPRGSVPIGLRLWVLHGRMGTSAFPD